MGAAVINTAMIDMAPAALALALGSTACSRASSNELKLKKNELGAIAFRFFGAMLKEPNSKTVLVTAVEALIAAQPGVLVAAGIAAAAGAPLPAVMPQQDGEDGGGEEEEDKENENDDE